jgi:CubicO group peptidase (beta-lactamase class C family)
MGSIGRASGRIAAAVGFGLVIAAAASAALDDRIVGRWQGAIEVPGQKLEYDIDFAVDPGGGVTGDISIPAQNAVDLPLTDIVVQGDSVRWAIKGIPGAPTFDGTLAEGGQTIAGDFTQAGQMFPFKQTRGEAAAAAAKAATGAALEGFGDWIDKARQDWKVPGVAALIVKGDQVVFAQGFGERDTEKHLPVTTRTLFAIGSATKAFTTFTIGTLVDEGKLDWDRPVNTWLPEFRVHDVVASERMTPRDLVTHRSGLPRHDLVWYNNFELDRAGLVGRLPFLEESKDFRTTFQYNNLMYITAGYLVERVTGGSWEDAVRQRIFEPLGMTYSVFSWADAQKGGDAALGYEERDDQLRQMDYREIPAAGPAGSINSCLEDLGPWVIMQLNGGKWQGTELIKAGTLADMHAPHMSMGVGPAPDSPEVVPGGYGLGWFNDTYRGHRRVHHGGNIDGFSALICHVPQERLGVVALVNMNGSPLPGLVARHAIDRMLALERVDWSAKALAKRDIARKTEKEAESKKETVRRQGTSPAHDLAEYAGQYENPGYGLIRIELSDGRLSATYNGITNQLDHWHFEVFTRAKAENDHTLDDQKIMFLTGMDGEVEGLRTSMEPSVEDAVFRKKADARLSDPTFLAKLVGEYELPPQTIVIELKGTALTATVPGQPTYDLVPHRGTTFNLKGLSGFSVRFVLDEGGKVSEAQFIQPNGVFSAKRK